MPELDGIAATERIRTYEIEHALTPIPIIALTAHALSSDQEVCLRAGMDGFVTKPIDVSTLKVWDQVLIQGHVRNLPFIVSFIFALFIMNSGDESKKGDST